jgi:quercetin dioxygenase-like cupin family protein
MPFRVGRVAIAPGELLSYNSAEWEESLVLVTAGELVLIAATGRRERFEPGASLVLSGLSIRAVACGGAGPVAIVRVSRPTDE